MTYEPPQYQLERTVFFVGFMGAGKTSVVRRLARLCGATAIDTDRYVERREGASVAQLFERDGEEGFRRFEEEALRDIAEMGPVLVACGGGIVMSEESRRIIAEHGFTVHLRVSADEAKERINAALLELWGCRQEHINISYEAVPPEEWDERIERGEIARNRDKMLICGGEWMK